MNKQLPLTTNIQYENFAEYICEAHSWYKHIPLFDGSPYRQNALELFSNLKIVLENKQNKAPEETELIMNLSPLYLEQIDIATQKGKDIGRNEGEKSLMIRMLTRKLGQLDARSIDLINSLSLESIESLSDTLLDFNTSDDLTAWLDKSLSGIQ